MTSTSQDHSTPQDDPVAQAVGDPRANMTPAEREYLAKLDHKQAHPTQEDREHEVAMRFAQQQLVLKDRRAMREQALSLATTVLTFGIFIAAINLVGPMPSELNLLLAGLAGGAFGYELYVYTGARFRWLLLEAVYLKPKSAALKGLDEHFWTLYVHTPAVYDSRVLLWRVGTVAALGGVYFLFPELLSFIAACVGILYLVFLFNLGISFWRIGAVLHRLQVGVEQGKEQLSAMELSVHKTATNPKVLKALKAHGKQLARFEKAHKA